MKKWILCALAISLLLASCGGNAPVESTENPSSSEETVLVEETVKKYADNVPEDLTFDGQELLFLIDYMSAPHDLAGDSSGDLVSDAIYKRNLLVEERFNIVIQSEVVETSEHAQIMEKVRQSVLAATEPYHVYMARAFEAISLTTEGMVLPVSELPYIDLNSPWWNQKYTADVALNSNEIYTPAGDICMSGFLYSNVLFFNKNDFNERFGDYTTELYEPVFDGTWTYDKYLPFVEQAYTDTNGDGEADSEDYYGFIYLEYAQGWYILSAGLTFTERDDMGYPILNLYSEETIKLAETLSDMFSNKKFGLRLNNTYNNTIGDLFANGQCLFLPGRFIHIDWSLRNMEDSFGILPYPKIEEYLDYTSGSANSGNLIAVPNNNTEKEMISAVVEALCAESNRSVFPVYYETALKIKYTEGGEDAEMIDLIHNCTTDTVLGCANINRTAVGTIIGDVVMDGKGNTFTSYYNANIGAKEQMLAEIIETYKKSNER